MRRSIEGARYGSRTARRARAGFTIVEIMIAVGILAFAALALSSSTLSSMRLAQTNRETALAQAALRQAVENLQAVPFDQIFALYNDDPADDPAGMVAPGSGFDVPGLDPRDGDADGRVGSIELPIAVVAGQAHLTEEYVDGAMGMPRDLNGDGDAEDVACEGEHQILPVRVRLEWKGKAGERVLEVRTIVGNAG